MRKLKREVGSWVAGPDRFYDRETEVELFIEDLDRGQDLSLLAQRRVGKTSMMHEVARRIESRTSCVFIDLQKAQTAADAMAELAVATRAHQSLWERTRDLFDSAKAAIHSLKTDELLITFREGFGASWQARATRLLEDLARDEKKVIIFIDELPILVNRLLGNVEGKRTPATIREAELFMSFLSSQAEYHKERLTFVVCGSIGLEPILQQAGLSSTAKAFQPFMIGPWDNYVAIGCIEALARGSELQLADGVTQRMVGLLGSCVPHHVQMFFNHLYTDARRHQTRLVSVDDVDRVFEKSMLSSRGHTELSHFEERLGLVLPREDLYLAFDLLTEAAVTGKLTEAAIIALVEDHTDPPSTPMGFLPTNPTSVSPYEHLARARYLLAIFEHDGYLRREADGYVFESNLVKQWWKARFQIGFVPASQRKKAR